MLAGAVLLNYGRGVNATDLSSLPRTKLTAAVGLLLALAGTSTIASAYSGADELPTHKSAEDEPAWCPPELETLAEGVCFSPLPERVAASSSAEAVAAAGEGRALPAPIVGQPKTLVIFLHSLVTAKTDWQWQQYRMLARSGKEHGYAVLMPRGRLGIGPGRDPGTWAWPGAPETQKTHEAEVVDEWMAHKAAVEKRLGAFEQLYVFGFSNGAYYATSLAMRGRLPVDGYGVFAGGSGSRYHRICGNNTTNRPPVFVGYGKKDPDHHRQNALLALLAELHWPHHHLAANVGHMATDAQLGAAVRFLRSRHAERPQ